MKTDMDVYRAGVGGGRGAGGTASTVGVSALDTAEAFSGKVSTFLPTVFFTDGVPRLGGLTKVIGS